VTYGVLWRPLPYPDPDRLVIVSSAQQTGSGVRTFSTQPSLTYEGLRTRVTTFDRPAASTSTDVQHAGRGEPLHLPAVSASPNFFGTLGANPALGRAFLTGAAGQTTIAPQPSAIGW
jgi:putative ABC transport system permease protein